MEKKTTNAIIVAVIVLAIVAVFGAQYGLFSTYTTTRTCDGWIANEQSKDNIDLSISSMADVPFCWLEDGVQERAIIAGTPTSTGGCEITYELGCEDLQQYCSAGQEKCSGTNYFSCLNGYWQSEGHVIGKCGVECLSNSDCSTDETCEDYSCTTGGWDFEEPIWTINGFEIQLWMILVGVIALILLLVILNK